MVRNLEYNTNLKQRVTLRKLLQNPNILSKNLDKSDYKIVFMGNGESTKVKVADTEAVEDLNNTYDIQLQVLLVSHFNFH